MATKLVGKLGFGICSTMSCIRQEENGGQELNHTSEVEVFNAMLRGFGGGADGKVRRTVGCPAVSGQPCRAASVSPAIVSVATEALSDVRCYYLNTLGKISRWTLS